MLPDNLRALPLSTHTIRLTWSIRLSSGNVDSDIEVIDGFYIGYRPVGPQTMLDLLGGTASIYTSGGTNKQTSSSALSSASGSDVPTSASYTYKTITNNPIQSLYSKTSLSSDKQQLTGSVSVGGPGSAGGGVGGSSTFLIKLHNQSTDADNKLPRTSNSAGMKDSASPINTVHHQYYEHVVDTLLRQTQYQ